jgi:hypothetical protein
MHVPGDEVRPAQSGVVGHPCWVSVSSLLGERVEREQQFGGLDRIDVGVVGEGEIALAGEDGLNGPDRWSEPGRGVWSEDLGEFRGQGIPLAFGDCVRRGGVDLSRWTCSAVRTSRATHGEFTVAGLSTTITCGASAIAVSMSEASAHR